MQQVPALFNEMAHADIQPLNWGLLISFDKTFDTDIIFFTLDESTLNGTDVLGTEDNNPIQVWDKYEYESYRERVISLAVTRELDFPYSIVSAIADFTLNNYDRYFTPNSDSPIAQYILPKRPVRLLQGFHNTVLPQFVGLTQGMPEIDEGEGTATFTAMDFLTQIYGLPVRETIAMSDVTTDEVLENIFTQFGLSPDQYDLAKGRNVIKFLFFERNQQTAGDVIRPLMQAEMGMLWLDEEGIIRFRPRLEQPDTPVYTFDEDSILSCEVMDEDQLINHLIISTDVREVQDYTTVYSKNADDSSLDVVPAGGTYVFKAELTDPLLTVEEPVYGQNADVSWFTATRPDGTVVSSGISITATEIKTNTYEMTIENTNAFSVNINQMSLWGRPARRISLEPVVYENKDTDSIAKYEDKILEIDNNFVQSIDAARALALTILDEYSEYADIIEVEVKGNPALQLGDVVEIDYPNFEGEYRIISVTNRLQDSKFTQILRLRKYEPREWFTLDQSTLNGGDIFAP